jgi:imidazole glycerol-phosphate synthase subunit HisF
MKKRLIFTLLYEKGSFVLSRNFRTQKIGDINWLHKNYNFAKVASHIDELIVINVSRDREFDDHFRSTLSELLSGVFVPMTAGGGVRSLRDAESLFAAGADKILLNYAIHHDIDLVGSLAEKYGQQAVVGSLDVRTIDGAHHVFSEKGSAPEPLESYQGRVDAGHIGEVYLNSIDRDGTGNGMDVSSLAILGHSSPIPVILAGGAGKPAHLSEAIASPAVNAVATANLLNFVGDGLRKTRVAIRDAGINLAQWD